MKLCPKCQEIKPFAEFGLHRSQKSGLRSWCKACSSLYRKKYLSRTTGRSGSTDYYRKNKEVVLKSMSEKRMADPEAARRFEQEQYLKHKEARKVRDRDRYINSPQVAKAKSAVGNLVARGHLLPARNYLCISCGKQASDHHHPSYREEDLVNVVPLCRSCHVKAHHRDDFVIPGGIVVLPIGVVRIAIATG